MNPIANERIHSQLIAGAHACVAPEDVVAHMGAMQAQDYSWAKWAVALRCAELVTEADVEEAVAKGRILRTHAFRATWQFICPADLRWMCGLIGPLLIDRASLRHDQLDLGEATFKRSNRAIEALLRDRGEATRHEIADALRKARVSPDDQRLPYLLMRAELEALICSGARRGKHATYALVDERLRRTKARSLSRDEALGELARRYFTSRGPATAADFRWWSSLPAKDVNAAIESIRRSLAPDVIGRVTYYRPNAANGTAPSSRTRLLPAFDEYLVAYKNRDAQLDPAHVKRINAGGGLLAPVVVIREEVTAIWSRIATADRVVVDALPLMSPLKRSAALLEETARYGRFIGGDRPVELRIGSPPRSL